MDVRWRLADEITENVGVSRDTVYAWLNKREMLAPRERRLWKLNKAEDHERVPFDGAADVSYGCAA